MKPQRLIDKALDTATVLIVVVVATFAFRAVTGTSERTQASSHGDGALNAQTVADILTQPDSGPAGTTSRWDQDTVTVRVELPDTHQQLQGTIDAALVWNTAQTGIPFRRTDSADADMTITAQTTPGGHVTITSARGDGKITAAKVTLGCCLERPVWEEIAQAAGATGDRAAGGSVFSNNNDVIAPTDFDALVIQTLYQLPVGSSAGDILSHLAKAAR